MSEPRLHHVRAELVTYRGHQAVRLVEQGELTADDPTIAILPNSDFVDGVIEAEIAGDLRTNAPHDMRSFVGIAFRVQPHFEAFSCGAPLWLPPV